MAIDKNSKAYQSLLNSGYTDEQITQMHDQMASGASAQTALGNQQPPYAWNVDQSTYKGTDANGNVTVWPQNANLNYNQYWDDSNPNQQSQRGWLNDKYTWEGVSNTYIDYNPNLRLWDLDPNYLYWDAARQQNRKEAGYIARRNDQIASALYNEWLVSREDVANWLWQQKEWMNSTEEDRLNTIESVWKRLGQIKPEWEKPDPSKADQILNDTSGKLYGKVTAEEGDPQQWIETLADANSVFRAMEESRVANLKSLINYKPSDIAAMELSGISPFGEQTMRDARQYYPEFVAEIEAEKKKQLAQENVQSIASGGEVQTSADKVDTNTANTSYAVSNSTSSTSATQLLKWIDSILESNDTAKSAQDLMGSIEKDMATLKNRMKNLREEANRAFKWDVPDYLVNAYMNNKSQEIQNQLSILEDRYNAAYERYKTELSNAQWQAEYDLKKQSLELDEWKAKNWATWNGWTWTPKMRTERNNNPTAMTTDVAKMLGWVLWVDYEIWDSWTSADWRVYYTAKLIWDPIETTIRLIDRWIANGIDPFYRANWQGRWSYISKIWVTKDKWLNMSPSEKANVIAQMLKYEWGSMENMLYYTQLWEATWASSSNESYNEDYAPYYQKLLDADYTAMSRPEKTAQSLGYSSVTDFRNAAMAWKKAEENRIAEEAKNKPKTRKRKDWTEFDMSDTPTFDTLTYDQKNIVYQLLNLNKNPATVNKRQYGDDFEKILSAVKEINPNWSDADYWQADKVKKEWNTSSKNGSNSRNWTAIATAKDIYEIADEFGNIKFKDWNGMLNKLRDKLSDEKYTQLVLNLEVLASEYAWALKGNNAAPTEQEIADKKEIIAANLWAGAMKQAAKDIAKTLYNKNANEADSYYAATLTKPPLVVTKDVADWMYNEVWIKSLPDKYQYTPSTWWTTNAPKAPKIDVSGYKWQSIWTALGIWWSSVLWKRFPTRRRMFK